MNHWSRKLSVMLALFSLTGCQSLWTTPQNWATQKDIDNSAEQPEIAKTNRLINNKAKQKKINIAKTLSKALHALGKGKPNIAEKHLRAVLSIDPDNKSALEFIKQIQVDPKSYFGPDFFTYTAKKGDSMTKISERFLNDHLKFYILSRYSGINDPSSLVMGQTVKIPIQFKPKSGSTTTARIQPKQTFKNNLSVMPVVELAQQYMANGKYLDAINLLEASDTTTLNTRQQHQQQRLLANAYVGRADQLDSEENYKRAILFLKKAAKLSSEPNNLSKRISKLSNQIEAEKLIRLAKLHEKSGQLEIAFDNINKVLALTENSNLAHSLKQRIKLKLVEQYHEKALELFEEKRLHEALDIWNKALELEPTHLLSRSYRERCISMIQLQSEIKLSYSQ